MTLLAPEDRSQAIDIFDDYLAEVQTLLAENTLATSGRLKFAFFLAALLERTKKAQQQIDAWGDKFVPRLYRRNIKDIDEILKNEGVRGRSFSAARGFKKAHDDAIRMLLENPEFGIGPRLTGILTEMEGNLTSYAKAHKRLMSHLRFVKENIADGIVSGKSADDVIEGILKSFTGNRTEEWAALQRFQSAGRGGVLRTLADAPYLKVPLATGGFRKVHIRDHVKTTVVTMESQVRTQARVNRMTQRNIRLAQVSPNPPLRPDVCSIYAGRVFSLDQDTETETGYPQLSRTPNGGPPFHPNCFVPTTTVVAYESIRTINMIRVGDEVLSADGRWRKVLRVYKRPYKGPIFQIYTKGRRHFYATPNHKVITAVEEGKGLILDKLEKSAKNPEKSLDIGTLHEMVKSSDKKIYLQSHEELKSSRRHSHSCRTDVLVNITPSDYNGYVFNLEVEGDHTYYANGIAVHNCTHTVLPFVPNITDNSVISDVTESGTRVSNERGVPRGVLDATWEDAQQWLKDRGGFGYALQQNPQLARQRPPSRASAEIKRALK